MNDISIQPESMEGQQLAVVPMGGEERRAVAEVKAQVALAKMYPRDTNEAALAVAITCKRTNFAEKAFYSYPRGGSTIKGPSIRMAEMLAQAWGNIQYGWKEVERDADNRQSRVIAMAWDTQTNARQVTEFVVKHIIDTKQGPKALRDQRDIEDLIANKASRKLRGCILRIIPAWLADEAIAECEKTLTGGGKGPSLEQRRQRMVKEFAELGVTTEMLEKKIQHPLSEITPGELTDLLGVFNALRDNAGSVDEYFERSAPRTDKTADIIDAVNQEQKKA
jgi:hypothetical protein